LEVLAAVEGDVEVEDGVKGMAVASTRRRRRQRLGEELMADVADDDALGIEGVPLLR